MMMYPPSSGESNVTPGAIANTACYDPRSRCIRLPPEGSEGGAVMEGSIIEMDSPDADFRPGRLLLGEIVEIVIMDENMQPLAVFDESNKPKKRQLGKAEGESTAGDYAEEEGPTREELLTRQREQQQLHYGESQELLQKHREEKERLEGMYGEGRMPFDSKIQLSAEMSQTHQRELVELQERQQREQSEMMDLIFESASSSAASSGGSREKSRVEAKNEQPKPPAGKSASGLWNRAAVSAVAARTMNQNHQETIQEEEEEEEEDEEIEVQHLPTGTKTAGLWNRAAVTAVAADAMTHGQLAEHDHQSTAEEEEEPAEKKTAGPWNRAAVTAVAAGTMNRDQRISDVSLKATEDELRASQQMIDDDLAESHHRALAAAAAEEAGRDLEELKKIELRAVMVDRDAAKDEKLRRMAAIKERYAGASPAVPVKAPVAQTMDRSLPSDKQALDKMRRAEIQAVMKDASLDKAEKQRRLGEIKAKYAAATSAPAQTQQQQPKKSAGLWNRAAVSAVAANAVVGSKGAEPKKVQIQAPPSTSGGGVSKWKLVQASAFAGSSFTTSFKNMKQVQGAVTPMSEFVRKLKANDPELKTIMLDGRKDVTDSEWTNFFDAIEENTHLTHLSAAGCGLKDDVCVNLVLALVENETLTSLTLSNNRGLTDSTGKSLLKVLRQSNAVIKQAAIDGTAISAKISRKVQNVLDDRDDVKKMEKMQEARQKKIKELLAFSASDAVSANSQRLSQKLLEAAREDEEDRGAKTVTSGSSASSGSRKGKRGKASSPKKHKKPAMEKGGLGHSARSVGSAKSSRSNSSRRKSDGDSERSPRNRTPARRDGRNGQAQSATAGTGTRRDGRSRHAQSATAGSASAHWKSAAKASMTARAMASMGGDMVQVGKNFEEVRESRRMRGECPECGIKCFNKTLFKTVPLTVPGKVLEGRCLKCAQ